jgi:DNA mismatch repair ATPase MutL
MGEALGALCKCADVKIFTRHRSSPTGFKLIFTQDGNLLRKTPIMKEDVGTTIEVRGIHKAN